MQVLERGRLRARLAEGAGDVLRAQALRHQCFRGRPGVDADRFDALCSHMLVEDAVTGAVAACYRLRGFATPEALADSYSAQFYDLRPLSRLAFPAVEMGRFCILPGTAPGQADPDVLRLAWAAMTRFVDAGGFGVMFGCTSFHGADPARHHAALAVLRPYLAKDGPIRRGAETVGLRDLTTPADARAGLAGLPPVLRTYLGMGGWVSDHAVIDHDLDTLHVFTAVEVARVPAARARALRALAG